MEAVRIVFYALTIISATVCWCLAAGFLALTSSHLDTFWRGDVALLVFGILAMLILPILLVVAHGHQRKNMTGPTVAEVLTLFTFWCLFLAASAKFSASYHSLNGWNRRCRIGFSICSTGRALLSFGWITFGFLTVLLPICIAHGILAEKKRTREERDFGGNREVKSTSNPATTTQTQPMTATPEHAPVAADGGGATHMGQPQVAPVQSQTHSV